MQSQITTIQYGNSIIHTDDKYISQDFLQYIFNMNQPPTHLIIADTYIMKTPFDGLFINLRPDVTYIAKTSDFYSYNKKNSKYCCPNGEKSKIHNLIHKGSLSISNNL